MWAELLLVLVVIVLFLIYKVQIPKSKAALLEGAKKSTKMTEFDFESNPRFLEGLELSISEMPRANLKVLGRIWVNFLLHRRLVERLKFINYLKLNPQIEKVPIEKPIFIVGLPRTGSTLLFNLLALDSGVQTLKLWELVYPIPTPFDPLTNEQRIRLIGAALKFQKTFSPQLNKIHFMDPLIPEEETLWFSQNNWFPGLAVGTATEAMSQWFLQQEDQTGDKALPMYRDFKRILQMRQVQSEKPPRWLFKGVLIHMHVLPALLRVFPDAQIIYLRRDPCEVVASSASLETEMGRHFQHLNEEQHAKQRMPLLVSLEKSLKNFRASLPKEQEKKQFLSLGYKQIVSDPIGTVKKAYEHFGLDFSDEYSERLNRYMKQNPQHKHGKHSYNLKKYGLTEEQVREAFAPIYGTE